MGRTVVKVIEEALEQLVEQAQHEGEEEERGAEDVAHFVLTGDELVKGQEGQGRGGGEEVARLLNEQLGTCTRAQRRGRGVPAWGLARRVRRHWGTRR